MKKVLIVTYKGDGTARLITDKLEEFGTPFQLLDISLFPKEGLGSIEYSGSSTQITFSQNHEEFQCDNVKSIWWRRPEGGIKTPPNTSMAKYVKIESDMFVRSLFYLLPASVRWVSDPEKTRIANSKPLQLRIAKEVGFTIPRTLISNNPDAVLSFLESIHPVKIIVKPVGTSYYRATEEEGGNRAIYTRLIDEETVVANLNMVKNCPVIYQEAICEKIDLRATVVGEKVFTVSITHNRDLGAGEDNLDWRNHKLERIYKPHDLPMSVQRSCVEVVRQLGLQFGAVDLCRNNEGEYFFFEVNPQGQWVPSELVAGLPISHALASLLSE